MFDIILDYDWRNGAATIWYDDSVSTIKGSAQDVAASVFKRVMKREDTADGIKFTQTKTIGVDTYGINGAIALELEGKGIKFSPIQPKQIDKILPMMR